MLSTVTIVGGGPAGSSLAIRLVEAGFDVTLIERETFPRNKVCGEFISPECFGHFDALGVSESMFARGGDRISETIFYDRGGRSLTIPSKWLGSSGALSLSRAEMDRILMDRAKEVGARVLESTRVVGLITVSGCVVGLQTRGEDGAAHTVHSDLIVDATGRSAVVKRLLDKKASDPKVPKRPPLLGFKVHLRDIDLEPGRCEIYSFDGGYGGLSYVEDGLANFCFLIKANAAKEYGGKAEPIFAGTIDKNNRAAVTLKNAQPVYDWLAVAVDRFGKKEIAPAPNVFTVGDAAAFIDPFTGSGMLLAFESAEVLSNCLTTDRLHPERMASTYNNWFDQRFLTRLRASGLIRNAAYLPQAATAVISLLGVSGGSLELLARTTRHGSSMSRNKR